MHANVTHWMKIKLRFKLKSTQAQNKTINNVHHLSNANIDKEREQLLLVVMVIQISGAIKRLTHCCAAAEVMVAERAWIVY